MTTAETAATTWPPNLWEVRRVTADFVPAFHVSEPGFMVERLPRGDIIPELVNTNETAVMRIL